MFEKLANIFRVPDLRKRVLFTLALLAVYRLGGHIPTPGINILRWEEIFSRNSGGIFGFFDLFAGGGAYAREAFQGRRAGAAQDYAVDPVPDRAPRAGAVLYRRAGIDGHGRERRH